MRADDRVIGELITIPGFYGALLWILAAADLEELELSVMAAKDCEMTEKERQQIRRAARQQEAILNGVSK